MAESQNLSYYWAAGQVQPLPSPGGPSINSSRPATTEPDSTEEPARKKRRKDENDLYFRSDAEVWDLEDAVILAASQAHWTSEAYPHYDVTLERNHQNHELIFRFHCKYNDADHGKHTYRRSRTKDHHGTTNLLRTAKRCDVRRGVRLPDPADTPMPVVPQFEPLVNSAGARSFQLPPEIPPTASTSSNPGVDPSLTGPATTTTTQRRRDPDSVADKKDEEVWDLEDNVILETSRARWSSKAYNHYNVSVERVPEDKEIFFRFTCKYGEPDHVKNNYRRSRMKAHHGTTSLLHSAERCDSRRGMDSDLISQRSRSDMPYNPYMFRALLALRCAVSKMPIDYVADKFFIMEARMLRPGVVVPTPQALESDVLYLYQRCRTEITKYFHARGRSVHLVYEKWPSRVHGFSGALMLVWEDEGKINRRIGKLTRVRFVCIFMFLYSLYREPADAAAKLRVDASARPANIDPRLSASSSQTKNLDRTIVLMSEVMRSFFTDASPEVTTPAETREKDTIRDEAKSAMAARNVVASETEYENCQSILSKVFGLVERIRKSRILQMCLRQHIALCAPLTFPEEVISVVLQEPSENTWAVQLQLLHACIVLQRPISALIGDPDVTLGDYQTLLQKWPLLGEVGQLLSKFEEIKDRFKVGPVTLLVDLIPALESLLHLLTETAENASLHSITRIAAFAGTLMCRRDYNPSEENDESWALSIVMCPNMKLAFFVHALQWPPERVAALRQRALDQFIENHQIGVDSDAEDRMESYLEQPPTPGIANGLDVLNYWQSQLGTLPKLARMGLSLTSVPASTNDVQQVGPGEQVNFDSSGMSSQTFEAIMCLSSWDDAPWFSVEKATRMLEESGVHF